MTGEEDEIVQVNETSTNIVRGKVHGTVLQFDVVDGDIVLNARESTENDQS
jgi:hypothetical protein